MLRMWSDKIGNFACLVSFTLSCFMIAGISPVRAELVEAWEALRQAQGEQGNFSHDKVKLRGIQIFTESTSMYEVML